MAPNITNLIARWRGGEGSKIERFKVELRKLAAREDLHPIDYGTFSIAIDNLSLWGLELAIDEEGVLVILDSKTKELKETLFKLDFGIPSLGMSTYGDLTTSVEGQLIKIFNLTHELTDRRIFDQGPLNALIHLQTVRMINGGVDKHIPEFNLEMTEYEAESEGSVDDDRPIEGSKLIKIRNGKTETAIANLPEEWVGHPIAKAFSDFRLISSTLAANLKQSTSQLDDIVKDPVLKFRLFFFTHHQNATDVMEAYIDSYMDLVISFLILVIQKLVSEGGKKLDDFSSLADLTRIYSQPWFNIILMEATHAPNGFWAKYLLQTDIDIVQLKNGSGDGAVSLSTPIRLKMREELEKVNKTAAEMTQHKTLRNLSMEREMSSDGCPVANALVSYSSNPRNPDYIPEDILKALTEEKVTMDGASFPAYEYYLGKNYLKENANVITDYYGWMLSRALTKYAIQGY